MPDDLNSGDVSDVMGQDDIDSLLQQVSGGGDSDSGDIAGIAVDEAQGEHVPRIISSDGRRFSNQEFPIVEPYDFTNPAFLGETEMRRLRLLHEEFIRYLEARFTLFLGCDFSLNMTQLSTKSYDKAIQDVENPTHISLFRASPMPGVGFIEMSPNLALTIASSIIGGKGHALRLERYLTAIEVDLIEEFLMVLLEEWCAQWKMEVTMEPQVIGHEIVANVIQICEHDAIMFSLSMEANIRGASGRISICVPLFMIEAAIRDMQARQGYEGRPDKKVGALWRNGYEQIPVCGQADLSLGKHSVAELMKWEVGTVLPLNDGAMGEVTLKLADLPFFYCEAGIDNEHRAVKILEKIKKKDSIWEMVK
jgi:flagellar motor switch protein FliM